MLRVAVVGSGPAGVYVADALTRRDDVTVDVLDRLPAPYGLVRYGVAPDHLKMKAVGAALQKVLEKPTVRFLGNVDVGHSVSVAELRDCYDVVVYAYGAAVDRRMGVPGEDLPGSFSATEFVSWYSGHPDADVRRFTLDASGVVVIGVGNVAVDVTRVLAKTADELRATDVPDHVVDVLATSKVADIHMVGRRGPAQAKFTTKELRELGEIANADVVVHPEELVLDEASNVALAEQPVLRRNLDVLQEWSTRSLTGRPRRIHVRFLLRPAEVLGTDRVSGMRFVRTALDGSGGVTDTEQTVEVEAQMVLRSVGYHGTPLPAVPFDERAGVIPNDAGRVLRDGRPSPGEYAVGWIKRGPTGVIGTNKSDAAETVTTILADADALPSAPERDPDALCKLLAERDVEVVTWAGWEAIDAAEVALGKARGCPRVKVFDTATLLDIAAGRR